MINNLSSHKLIGFDASDTIRSATIVSSGFSSLPTLRHFNTFRIDGKLKCFVKISIEV